MIISKTYKNNKNVNIIYNNYLKKDILFKKKLD